MSRYCKYLYSEVFFLNPNLETGWRLTRVCYSLSVTAAGQHELNYLNEGMTCAKKYLAMEGGTEHPFARKWAGLITGAMASHYKPKEKVAASAEIRKHFDFALTKLPTDHVLLHAMGLYCFNIASMR